jgi:glycerophosphoryl diester phosphodiesterase
MIKKLDVKIYVWTLDDMEKYQRIEKHIDAVITNQVELFVNALKKPQRTEGA